MRTWDEERRESLGWMVLIAVLVAALYGRTVGFPFSVLDDIPYLVENPLVSSPDHVAWSDRLLTPNEGYMIPISVGTWAALFHLGHGNPWIFHLFSVLLHALFVIQLFLLALHVTRNRMMSGILSTLFAVHPLVVEPVAWVTGSKDLLMANLALAATRLFVHGLDREGPEGRRRLVLASVLAMLSILSKPGSVLLGWVWVAYVLSIRVLRRPAARSGEITAWVTAVLGLVLGGLSWIVRHHAFGDNPDLVGFGDFPFWFCLGHQVRHLLFPMSLHPLYAIDPRVGFGDPKAWLGLAAFGVWGGLAWRARRLPAVFLGLVLAAGLYLPVSNLIPFSRKVADSYLYLPLAGLLLAAGSYGAILAERFGMKAMMKNLVLLSGAALALGLAGLSYQQVGRWREGRALWQPVIDEYPDWDRGYSILAGSLMLQGKDAEAARLYETAFRLGYRSKVLSDFGVALVGAGRLDEAECVLTEAVSYGDRRDRALFNYAVLLGSWPGRPPVYPETAALLVPEILDRMASGSLRSEPRLRKGLMKQLERLGPPQAAKPWPRANCPILRTRIQGGVLHGS